MALELLERIEAYCDLVPRASATVEALGPFTVFVGTGAWRYYARPRTGVRERIAEGDVAAVVERLRALGQPLELEWIDELRPELAEVATGVGMTVVHNPLLVLTDPQVAAAPAGITLRVADPGDAGITATRAAIELGFRDRGTEVGDAGPAERDAAAALANPTTESFVRDEIASRGTIMVLADSPVGPVGGGSASVRGAVAELTGIATLPSMRRQGIGRAVTAALADATRTRGVDLAFLGAAGDDVARVYERAGFTRVATACQASRDS